MPSFGTVIFDCDSTLSTIEGVEELAGSRLEQIAKLTEQAMDGKVPLEKVYRLRLDRVRPTRQMVEDLGQRYIETLVPDAARVVSALEATGTKVCIVSGGLKPAVSLLASHLGIRPEAVAAVDIAFGPDGAYSGFDAASPLARAGGKREVIEAWKPPLPPPIMLVGDGATDLEAKPAVDLFVAFTGVVARPAIAEAADRVVQGPSLLPVLDLALGGEVEP
jgi:phosphoserine phosphatase